MRRKKIEKLIFNILMLLPFLLTLIYFLVTTFSLQQSGEMLTCTDYLNVLFEFTVFDAAVVPELNPPLLTPITYFVELLGMPMTLGFFLGWFISYLVTIELLKILYDFIMFLPRVLRSMIERGLND